MNAKERKWYQKKRYLIPIGVLALAVIFGTGANAPSPSAVQGTSVAASAIQANPASPAHVPLAPIPSQTAPSNDLSNSNSYVNVDGNTVHSPAYSENDSIPSGASARCGDGTYSFSQHRSGTCSHHGGVMTWLE